MKVALISIEGGGISSVTSGLARSLAKKGIDTSIYTGAYIHSRQTVKLGKHLELNYLPTINTPPRHYWFQAFNLRTLIRELKNYDVIHGVSLYASFFLSLLKNKMARPFVATLNEDIRTSQKMFINQPISSWSLREMGYFFLEFPFWDIPAGRIFSSADYVTFCSRSLFDQVTTYRRVDYNKVSVIRNGLDFNEIESVNEEPAEDENKISAIFAGRLLGAKGVMLLIKAVSQLGEDFQNVDLKIFGKGPLRNEMEKMIVKYNLKNRVHCIGQVSHKKLIAEIKKSHMVVFPSLNEAQPMFVLEAMACKKPVLAFDLPFARELITDMESGLLAEPCDVEDLSKKIGLLANDKTLRLKLGEAAYNYVKEKHNWDIQSEEYLDVYTRLINGKQQNSDRIL